MMNTQTDTMKLKFFQAKLKNLGEITLNGE